jgi:hypothetical protein
MLSAIRENARNPALKPNGPEGSLPDITIDMFTKLSENTKIIFDLIHSLNPGYQIVNSSLLSVPCEHHFSVMRQRFPMPTMLQYCEHLGVVVAETLKKLNLKSYHYYTHKDSFYPTPTFQDVSLPINERSNQAMKMMADKDRALMLHWRQDFCAGK